MNSNNIHEDDFYFFDNFHVGKFPARWKEEEKLSYLKMMKRKTRVRKKTFFTSHMFKCWEIEAIKKNIWCLHLNAFLKTFYRRFCWKHFFYFFCNLFEVFLLLFLLKILFIFTPLNWIVTCLSNSIILKTIFYSWNERFGILNGFSVQFVNIEANWVFVDFLDFLFIL